MRDWDIVHRRVLEYSQAKNSISGLKRHASDIVVIRWIPSPFGWIQQNSDGVVKGDSGMQVMVGY